MIENIQNLVTGIQGNQMLLALMGGGIFYKILSNVKGIFSTIWNAIIECISFTFNQVTVGDYDQPVLSYKLTKVLSDSKVLWERNTELRPASSDWSEKRLTNSVYGRSYRWLLGHFVIIDRDYSTQSNKVVNTVRARVFFANRKKYLKKLMETIEATELVETNDVIVSVGGGITVKKPRRSIDSIYSNDNIAQRILKDIHAFIHNRKLYIENSTPHKFVALLAGTPGSGKTSLIHAIASELKANIRFINTDKYDFEDIAQIMTRCTNYSTSTDDGSLNIIVIEDVDCISLNANSKRVLSDGKSESDGMVRTHSVSGLIEGCSDTIPAVEDPSATHTPISLSAILNLLDGLITPSGTIVFLTTNKPESLDAALLRDGRIDGRYNFGNLNGVTANKMVKTYLNFEIDNIKDDIVPASLQRDILKVRIGQLEREAFIKKYINA